MAGAGNNQKTNFSVGGTGSGDGLTPFSEDVGNTTITDGGTPPISIIKFLVEIESLINNTFKLIKKNFISNST